MRLVSYLTLFIIAVFVYWFYVSQVQISVLPTELVSAPSGDYYDYRGVGNVLTNVSRGSSSPIEVISDAKKVGLDFLILTDVNKFSTTENVSGYHGNLLVMDEGEYSYLDFRLQLLSMVKMNLPESSNDAHLFFTDLISQKQGENVDQMTILVSPFQNGEGWPGELPAGISGIEVLNPKMIAQSAWKKSKISVLWSLFVYPFNPTYAFLRLFQEPNLEISYWDKLTQERKISAFAGADASARAIPYANYLLKFPGYQRSLEIVSNHVLLESELTGNFHKDRAKLFTAIAKGQFYLAMDLLGNPKGFNVLLADEDRNYLMGSRVKLKKNMNFLIQLPALPKYHFEVLLMKNGTREAVFETVSAAHPIRSKGVYRVVVRVLVNFPFPEGKKWITWIYSNPFYLE